jgi:copper chaperone CopZ
VAVERVDGVLSAEFHYPAGRGTVTFDSTRTSIDLIVRELERLTDFRATHEPIADR